MNGTSVQTTAGLGGFIVLFALAVIIYLLGRDMTRRIRRLSLQEEDEWLGEDGRTVRTAADGATAPASDAGAPVARTGAEPDEAGPVSR